jgi:hypothetical protein
MQPSMLPRSLRAVAVIQLVVGLGAVVGILVQLTRNHVILDFNVLGIPICFGLRRLSSGWRTCTLVFLWIGLIGAPVMFVLGLGAQRPAIFGVFGVRLASVPSAWLAIAALLVFGLCWWQYRVLTSPEVRSLFLRPVAGMPASGAST